MPPEPLDASDEIDRIARSILSGSKAFGKFPTPVDQIIEYTELSLANGIDLSRADPGFLASVHAAVRRYVERSSKRCGLLVFQRSKPNEPFRARVLNYFESRSFTQESGGLHWPVECGLEFNFIKDMQRHRGLPPENEAHPTPCLRL